MSAVQAVSSFRDDEFFRLWVVSLLLANMVDNVACYGHSRNGDRWNEAYRALFRERGKAKQIPIGELIEILNKYRGGGVGFREYPFEATIKPDSSKPLLTEGRRWVREELERVSLGFREQFEKLGREDEGECPL